MRLQGFSPVVDEDVEVLVLGSFPGVASLEKGEYYGFGRNQFWHLMGAALDEDLSSRPYEERLRVLLEHHVGLWDVIASCSREGSLDGNIRGAEYNDFSCLHLPRLRLVCCNGQKAFEAARELVDGVRLVRLPSSSPARAMAFEEKVKEWKEALGTRR